jgi:hypothetical protein
MATAAEVLNAARELSSEDRAIVAHELLLTLEPEGSDDAVEQAWAVEIRERLRRIREGRVEMRDWDEALADIRKSIQAKGTA